MIHILDNSFLVFKSINDIIYLIYANKNCSIISYNLIDNKIVNKIKNAHKKYIMNFRYYFDNIYKRDLFLSISAFDNNIKLWNFYNFECLLNIEKINKDFWIYSSCILKDNNENYIITSNTYPFNHQFDPIKVFDFKGIKIKEINGSNENIFFIDSYYDINLSKNYILAGMNGNIKSFDFQENKIYRIYKDEVNNDKINCHRNIIININGKTIKLIESCTDGNIRIWDFHSAVLISKIEVSDKALYDICLWNDNFLFVSVDDISIKIIDLINKKIIKILGKKEVTDSVASIKKIIHPLYGECLIIQAIDNGGLKLWINKQF